MRTTGIEAFLHMLAEAGVRYVFGNPGTTELPLNDALVSDRRIQYILGLQEVPVMAMADGYAMASRSLGVVNLHISCGLGNAMGMLYNAFREGTPLLVTAGQQDRRLKFQEPILYGDMVAVARPWTKWAVEVERVEDLAAGTAPRDANGPDAADRPGVSVDSDRRADARGRAGPDARGPAFAFACGRRRRRSPGPPRCWPRPRNPAILVGSRVQEADAVEELVAVAERLGCAGLFRAGHAHGRLGFPADHPLYGQTVPLWAPEIAARLAEFDVLLVAGMDLLREYVYHGPEPAIPRLAADRALRRKPRADRQELSGGSRRAGRHQDGPGRAGRAACRDDERGAVEPARHRDAKPARTLRCIRKLSRNCGRRIRGANAMPGRWPAAC